MSGVTWREDPLLGNTVDGVCPAGSDEAWAAVLRVRGPNAPTHRIVKPTPAPKPKERNLVRCACGALFEPYSGRQVRCGPCDGELTMRQAQQRVELWRVQEREQA